MKRITSRMTFSSFGGFFAGPARCVTAIVREGDNTGPGGAGANMAATELLDATIDAGKKLALAIGRELSGPETVIPIYPLDKRKAYLDTGFVWDPSENSGGFVEAEEREKLEKFLFQSMPVGGALAWLYGNGLAILEEFSWLWRNSRAFSSVIACRILYEVSCNARWFSSSDSEARAEAFWECIRAIEQIKIAHGKDVEMARERMKEIWKNNAFCRKSLREKAKSLGLGELKDHDDIYGITSDIVHGHHFWVLPMSEDMDTPFVACAHLIACREFIKMAGNAAQYCCVPEKEWDALFGRVIRQMEEESRRV